MINDPVLSDLLTGIWKLLLVGASWCLVGVIFGMAPKKKLDTGLIQFSSSIVSISASLIIALFFVKQEACDRNVILMTCGTYFLSGFFNFWGLQAMGAGMKRGPNGAVWGIMQSAMIAPFLVGFFFFHQQMYIGRVAGLILIIVALAFFALVKNEKSVGVELQTNRMWRFYAFLAFALICVQQNLATAPSYYPAAQHVSAVWKAFSSATGAFTASMFPFAVRAYHSRKQLGWTFHGLLNPWLYVFVFSMQFFSLIFAYTCFYPGMDAMARAGAGSISYPLMVGSCIVAFSLYAIFGLKEKASAKQIAAIVLCLLGLVGICLTVGPSLSL